MRLGSASHGTLCALAVLAAAAATPAAGVTPPATIAETDGKGNVDVNIVFYADQSCTFISDVKAGAPGNIEPPTRTLVVTVLLDRRPGECIERPYTIERTIKIPDRSDALSVDIFYVDPDGRFVRSQRPRIYRDTAGAD